MKILICFSLLLMLTASRGCQKTTSPNGADSGHAISTSSPENDGVDELADNLLLPDPCQPIVIYAYDDVSKSVNAANSIMAKQLITSSLRKHPEACVKAIKLIRFGAGSVWTTSSREFTFPLYPHCSAEPDYNELPPAVRNLEVWRKALRRQHYKQCKANLIQFHPAYDTAVSIFEDELLRPLSLQDGAPNSCTSFGNMIERVRTDISNSEEARVLVLSDLIWSCREISPKPLRVKGVIVQIATAERDDRIRTTPQERGSALTRIMPNVEVIQQVNAERAIEALESQTVISSKFVSDSQQH